MRRLNNRQKLTHRDPIARLLPRFKPQVTRVRTRYSRKGRAARRVLQDTKDPNGTLPIPPRSGASLRAL
jgi:hypothetical protein